MPWALRTTQAVGAHFAAVIVEVKAQARRPAESSSNARAASGGRRACARRPGCSRRGGGRIRAPSCAPARRCAPVPGARRMRPTATEEARAISRQRHHHDQQAARAQPGGEQVFARARRVAVTHWAQSRLASRRGTAAQFRMAALEQRLEAERDQRQHGEQRGSRECADEVVFVVEDLDVQRQRVGLAADVAGDHRHGAELAHRACVAQQDAIQHAPADVGQRDHAEDAPAAGARATVPPPRRRGPAPASAGSARGR